MAVLGSFGSSMVVPSGCGESFRLVEEDEGVSNGAVVKLGCSLSQDGGCGEFWWCRPLRGGGLRVGNWGIGGGVCFRGFTLFRIKSGKFGIF